MHVTKTITINRPIDEVYTFWRDFENLPRFMYHLEIVETTGSNRSHWVAKAPAGKSVEWDAEVTEDRPGELIAWRSVGNDDDALDALHIVEFRHRHCSSLNRKKERPKPLRHRPENRSIFGSLMRRIESWSRGFCVRMNTRAPEVACRPGVSRQAGRSSGFPVAPSPG